MKTFLLWIITLFSIASYSQGKYISIAKKNSERVITIEENKRIKIVTADGETYWGRFTVVDSATIMMDGNKIPLNSIVKVKRKSLVASIANPVFITVGSICVLYGSLAVVVGVATGELIIAAFGVPVLTLGTPTLLVPSISNNHPTSRNWEYAIKTNDKSGPFSNKIKVGQSESKEIPSGGKS